MDIKSEIERLDSEIESAEIELVQRGAHLAGRKAHRQFLVVELSKAAEQRPSEVDPSPMRNLEALDRTDAIVEVLRLTGREMSIREVWDGLKAGGRPEPHYQVIASTLNFLQRNGRINKTARGRYAA